MAEEEKKVSPREEDLPSGPGTSLERMFDTTSTPVHRPLDLLESFDRPYADTRAFWAVFAMSAVMGACVGLFAIAFFLACDDLPIVIYDRNSTPVAAQYEYLQGEPYWIGVGAATGLVVGVTKAIFLLEDWPHLAIELRHRSTNFLTALLVCILTIVGQIGGVPMGPEAGLGAAGAFGGKAFGVFVRKYFSPRYGGQSQANQKVLTLAGMAAALAPLFPSPFLSLILVEELAFETQHSLLDIAILAVATTASFAVHTAIVGNTYLRADKLALFNLAPETSTSYDFAIGILFGFAGIVVTLAYFLIAGMVMIARKKLSKFLANRFPNFPQRAAILVKCLIGGVLYGILNFIFPLVVGSGNYQLAAVAGFRSEFSSGLLVSSAVVRMLAYWIVAEMGFVGGLFFPLLLIGQSVGVAIIEWTGVSTSLALSCMLTTPIVTFLPAHAAAIFLPFFIYNVDQGFLFPIFTAVMTASLCFSGIGIPQALVKLGRRFENE